MTHGWTRGTRWTLVGLIALALLVPFAAAQSTTPAFSAPNPNNPTQSWAWGADYATTVTGTWSGVTANGTAYDLAYTLHGFLAWNTILNQTNTSTTAFTLTESRAAVASFYLSASGSYGLYTGSLNISAQGWETEQGSADFVTTGSVLQNGTTTVPALAITSASSSAAGNLTIAAGASLTGKNTVNYAAYLSAVAHGQASVSFSPALGVLPLTIVPGSNWTSTSDFTAGGNYTVGCHYYFSAKSTVALSGAGTCDSAGTLTASGSVTANGQDHFLDTVGGQVYRWITLDLAGSQWRFDLRDGFILVPGQADLYSGSAQSSSSGAPEAGSSLGVDHLDLNPEASHLGIVASNMELAPAVSSTIYGGNPNGISAPSDLLSLASPVSSNSGIQGIDVQGVPETSGAAESNNACIVSGACAGHTGPTTPATRNGGLFLLIVLVGAVALIVVVLATRRSGGPKGGTPVLTPYPGSVSSVPPGGRAPAGAPPVGRPAPRPGPNEDPLGNLW